MRSFFSDRNSALAIQRNDMAKKKRKVKKERLLILAGAGLAVLCLLVWGLTTLIRSFSSSSSLAEQKVYAAENTGKARLSKENQDLLENPNILTPAVLPAPTEEMSFTFTGVGDNLLHDRLYRVFEENYGSRDYFPMYKNIIPYNSQSDLNYINLETLIAGDAYGMSGYPAFNGPSEFFEALQKAGFNWLSGAGNHTYDMGSQAVMDEIVYAREHAPDLSLTGIHSDEADAAAPVVREINGVKVGLASFAFGMNGNIFPTEDWLIDIYRNPDYSINYDLVDQRIDALQDVSDVQIVSVHWGDEYSETPSDEQRELAQHLHEKGVEVIIGTHPHVIQPVEMLSTGDQDTLVYYSLGNFISGQDTAERMVGGMANFRMSYDSQTGRAEISDASFTPTVTLINPDATEFGVSTISEYNDEIASQHYIQVQKGLDMSKAALQGYVQSVMGEMPEGVALILE